MGDASLDHWAEVPRWDLNADSTNELDVERPAEHRRADADVRADVVQALSADALVPSTIEATVKDGVVTLTGTADRQSQRKEAEFVAGTIMGVTGVENDIDVRGPTDDRR